MSTDEPLKSPIADDLSTMQVALHLPCSRCGYELRELAAGGDCPECGEPIRLTIIDIVDPASKRLAPIQNPKAVGNSILSVVFFFFGAVVLYLIAVVSTASNTLPIPAFLHDIPAAYCIWFSCLSGFIATCALIPMMKLCRQSVLVGCKTGIMLTVLGLWLWILSMVLIAIVLLPNFTQHAATKMLLDTCLPVLASGLVFSGFRRLIPRLGQRSRAFRQAQGSRQRMNDLLAALAVIIVGRTLLAVSLPDSNLYLLGLIVLVMSLSLVVIGLGYLLRNTLWIRNALITPPPALPDLLKQID
jgi:hypothetical protein